MGRVNRLITGLLVIIFCMSAMVKITDKFDAKSHAFMRKEFERFAKVSPLTQLFKTKVNPDYFMRVAAVIEGSTGLFIISGPREVSIFGCISGIVWQATVIQMQYMLKNPIFTMIPATVAILLLITKTIILARTPDEEPPAQRLKKD
ncbi:uncharacterized protein LOC116299956 [Actinia tenebrosa]|uniref:Uncharacterized protein LOC116299956 n=1 Tax=Actinia tenebrosa TaxID=6105 RepID=A0A6P8IBA3_ACTTE|nr:uncharacterized protein LOC116299956 [Actinia tenebrosa]